MSRRQDYYEILGVPYDANAQDIKAKFRATARRFHPDVNSHPGAMLQFQEIATAYEVLNDELQRRDYDRLRQRLAPEPNHLTMSVTPSKKLLPVLGEAQVMYLLLQVGANPDFNPQNRKPTPLNLALVVDRSSSMRGSRLDRVKVAAHQIIDQLGENDYFSLVTFSDRADAVIKSERVQNPETLKANVNLITAGGGTEIFQGLQEGLQLVKRQLRDDYVNHIILLTDGQTYDDQNLSLGLADEALKKGIGISTMGMGEEWNDIFLDEIATKTGGFCAYINSPGAVVRFLNDRVRSLGSAYAERLMLSIAPDPDIVLESVFRLMPNPQPVDITKQPLPLGILEHNRPISILVQFQLPNELEEGSRSLVRLDLMGDILHERRQGYKVLKDIDIQAAVKPPQEEPPRNILDALGKLTLYRMQQKAEAAIKVGNFEEATRRLENLATRLLAVGQPELAQTVLLEAQRIQHTKGLSQAGQKTMKFGTRLLLLGEAGGEG